MSIKRVIWSSLLLSFLLGIASTLFYIARLSMQVDPFMMPFLKTYTIFPQIILIIALLIAGRKSSIDKIFKNTLITLGALVTLLGCMVPFQGSLTIHNSAGLLGHFLSPNAVSLYAPLLSQWVISLFYMVSSLLSYNLFSVLIWGFINQVFEQQKAIKYYILFAFLIGLVANPSFLLTATPALMQWGIVPIVLSAVIVLAISIIFFHWTWKKNDVSDDMQENPHSNRFPYLSAAYLLAGCIIVNKFFQMLFKSDLKMQAPAPEAYSEIYGMYSLVLGISILIISLLWIAIGTKILRNKGVRTAATIGSIVALIAGVVFIGLNYLSDLFLLQQNAIFSAILLGTKSALFFPLIQILYLYLPPQKRFNTKLIIELIGYPIFVGISPLILQLLFVGSGSMASSQPYIEIIGLISLGLLVLASRKIQQKT